MCDKISRRERQEGVLVALVPAALGLLSPLAAGAGHLSPLSPLLALPVGLWLAKVWGRVSGPGLPGALEEGLGPGLARAVQVLYLLWGLFLLGGSAGRFVRRLSVLMEGGEAHWLLVAVVLALCLWLGRGSGRAFARVGHLFALAVGAVLAVTLLLALPAVDWRNLWPLERGEWAGLLKGALLTLSLAGYGVYALIPPGENGEEPGGDRGVVLMGCLGLAAMALAVVGVFGPPLAARMEQPFFYLLEGLEAPGSFRRGEAALEAVLALADLTLLTLLILGCRVLFDRIFSQSGTRRGLVLPVLAFGAGSCLWFKGRMWSVGSPVLIGALILGILIPVWADQRRKRHKKP